MLNHLQNADAKCQIPPNTFIIVLSFFPQMPNVVVSTRTCPRSMLNNASFQMPRAGAVSGVSLRSP